MSVCVHVMYFWKFHLRAVSSIFTYIEKELCPVVLKKVFLIIVITSVTFSVLNMIVLSLAV